MHICIITETYSPEVNGVAMTLTRLVTGLLEKKHRVSLIRPKQDKYDRPGCCNSPEVRLVKSLGIPGYPGLRMGFITKSRLLAIWKNDRPEVIYAATEGPLGHRAIAAAESLKIPIISGFHTNFHTYTSHYRLGLFKSLIIKYLRNFHNRTALTLVPNHNLLEELQAMGIRDVRIFSRGVDCTLFSPQRRCARIRRDWGIDETGTALLYVGRLAHEKNINLAITTYREMLKQNCSLKFIIIGDGPLYGELRRKNPDIIFCGIHRGKTLARYYASADVFLFPSETETFGNVTLEAMASGLIILAYDYAAAKMHINNGINGYVATFGDSRAYIEAGVNLLATATETQKSIRICARQRAESIDWPEHINLFEDILTAAI
ncbi:Glycosyltransferase [hydrothermal vent metagenome]|uniref:Glycosyltransferase n=1 Tax=hydrothermal vent metagenome TaxID=652676 RepID=A0A3B1BI35_9ZZZZ